MADDTERTVKHWDEFTETCAGKKTGLYWMEVPEVLRGINRSISGDPNVDWAEYTVRKHFPNRLPLNRCLSLGSGSGELERNLARRKVFLSCDAYDISPKAVEQAGESARRDGFQNIRYAVTDINGLQLPADTYDAVWVYGAMHHFQSLEGIARQIAQALVPGGLLVMNEYAGPARFQFPERQKEIGNLCLRLLPRRFRLICPEALKQEQQQFAAAPVSANTGGASRILQQLGLRKSPPAAQADLEIKRYRESVGFPTAEQVVTVDPSEAVRSHEIFAALERDFELVEKVEWGGNIVQFLLAGIACNFTDEDQSSVELIRLLFQIERVLLQCGEIKSDFAYIVARPRQAGGSS
jgi:ubiquinone/menaquinone biosynthesis C-methylase UbiE